MKSKERRRVKPPSSAFRWKSPNSITESLEQGMFEFLKKFLKIFNLFVFTFEAIITNWMFESV